MLYYAAPMEGFTDRVWRQTHQKWFGTQGAADRYYAPFISPPENRVLIKKKMAELAPAANPGAPVIPQLLAKDGELAAWMIGQLRALGYTEVNLNLGCPAGTVTAKGKGSGMLRDPAKVDAFLDGVFSHAEGPVSVKTRLGVEKPEEFAAILDIYNRYPICELTIHPRVMRQLYRGEADRADVLPTEGNPVVYAEKTVDPGAKTVLVYGHYDVMPVDPVDEWRTSPFEPVVKDGRIWCRGADDDKGQLFMHAKAFEAMCATDSLPCNVKFLLEGEEEIGSPSLYKFCADNKKMLKADIILVSDTSMISMQIPSITCGLRGLTYMEVEVTGPNKDLHSGLFGGAVANPANVLARMVASLIDENGHVTIPGFYDDVRELTAAERKAFNKAPFNLTEYKKALEIGDVEGEAGFTTIERTGIRPSLDVNGIWGGYIEEGTKTVIPSKASAKISMRLVPGQDFKKIAKLFEKHFKAIAPKSVKVKVKFLHGGMPYVAPTDMPAYKAAEKAIADTFGKKPLPFYSGGSIPIISGFENILGIKSLLIGFGLAEDAIHSPNESYGLDQFYKGVETIPLFYKYFAEK